MLAMMTRMTQVPHRHFGMPGTVRTHTTVYTVGFAITLTVLFDLKRVAALGAIFYLLMDIAIHWGIIRHLRDRINVRVGIVATAIVLDVIVLGAFVWVKVTTDPLILVISAVAIALIVISEALFMRSHTDADGTMSMGMGTDLPPADGPPDPR